MSISCYSFMDKSKKMHTMLLNILLITLNRCVITHASNLNVCINNIVRNYCKGYCLIYTTENDLNFDSPVVRINLDEPFHKISEFSKVDIYILSQNRNITETMYKLSLTREFNPRALFVIKSDKNRVDGIFPVMAKYYIYKAIVSDTIKDDDITLYSYEPSDTESVNQISVEKVVYGRCLGDSFTMNGTLEVLPHKWRNTTINVLVTTRRPPYLHITEKGFEGVEIDILKIIQERLGFKIKFIRTNYSYWGLRLENGSYSMVLGELQERQGDMAMGMFHSKFDEHLDFDMSPSFSQDAVYWTVPAAKVLPAWRRISLIFDVPVWIALLTSLSVISLLIYIFYGERFVCSLYQILIEQGISHLHSADSFRIILTAWSSACLILTTAFKGNMMIIFIGHIFGYQIESLKEIVDSGLEIYLDHDMAKLFKDSSNPYERYVLENYHFAENDRAVNNRTAFVGDTVAADVKKMYKYLFPKYYVTADGVPLLHMLDEFLFTVNVRWYFVKGYPLADQINKYIYNIISDGIVFKLWNGLDYKIKASLGKLEKFQLNELGLSDLSVAFFIWICGISIAVVTFFVEIFIKRSLNVNELKK